LNAARRQNALIEQPVEPEKPVNVGRRECGYRHVPGARYFGGDARSWLNLQTAYDLRIAEISNAKRASGPISDNQTGGSRRAVPIRPSQYLEAELLCRRRSPSRDIPSGDCVLQ
jgi:hypothetical protein